MAVTQAQIQQLHRAITDKVAVFGQKASSVYQRIPAIKINSLNPVFPFFNDMTGYQDGGNKGIGGDDSQTLGEGIQYKPGVIHQIDYGKTIPYSLKRSLTVIDDPKGSRAINHIAKGIADSFFVKQERNFKNAIDRVHFQNGVNIFDGGEIHSDTAGKDFRTAVNDAIYYLTLQMQGVSDSRKIMMFTNQKAWGKLTGSQRLVNFFNGYADKDSNFNLQTINAIFSQNAQIEVEMTVANMLYVPRGYQEAQTIPIWGEENVIYIFVASDDPLGDRTAVKRLEGISEIRVWEEGLKTRFECYVDFGYMLDVESAFAKVTFMDT